MTAGPSRRTVALGLLVLSVGLMLANHFYGERIYRWRLNTDRTLYRPAPAPANAAPLAPALCRRVFVLILDGLRADTARQLHHVSRLLSRGSQRPLRSESPTFTYPNLTAMTTGVPPFYSGVRMNEGRAGMALDSLFDVAQRAGLPSRIVSDWDPVFDALDRKNTLHIKPYRLDLSVLLTRAPSREIAWIYFEEIDIAGHRHGARSDAYAEAAARGDALLGQLAAALDWNQDVLLALSDHGHRDSGGHGGSEPEVEQAFFLALGAHIRAGAQLAERPMRDVAPTLAALLGVPPPQSSLGAPMLDLLDVTPDVKARILAAALLQRSYSEESLGARITDDPHKLTQALAAGDASAIEPAQGWLRTWESQREQRIADALSQRRQQRLQIAGVVLVALTFLAGLAYRKRWLRPRLDDLLPLLVYLSLFFALFFARGYPLSWSVPRGAVSFIVETALIGLISAIGAAAARHLRKDRKDRAIEQASTVLLLWAVYIIGIAAAGHDPAWLESARISFAVVFLSTIEFYAAGFLGLLALSAAIRRSG